MNVDAGMNADPSPGPEQRAGSEQGADEETKRKFREALAAKHARRGEDHLDGGQGPGHAHGQAVNKRTFRRKSG